jgi:hypothetical protein
MQLAEADDHRRSNQPNKGNGTGRHSFVGASTRALVRQVEEVGAFIVKAFSMLTGFMFLYVFSLESGKCTGLSNRRSLFSIQRQSSFWVGFFAFVVWSKAGGVFILYCSELYQYNIFLSGDLLDEGLLGTDDTFKGYFDRFNSLFYTPEHVKRFYAAGNHDIGFHDE